MRTSTIIALLAVTVMVGCRKEVKVASPNPASWSISRVSGLLQPNSMDTVHFSAVLDSGWYIYSLTQKPGGPTPMSVTLEPSPPFTLVGNVIGPQPVVIFDKEFGIDTERYTGAPTFAAIVSIASGKTGPESADLKVRYQACNATFCLPARTAKLTTPVRIANP